ncbi:MAG: sigma 54-interacting transcriptional regulator [Melioribacteraceae bacterium]|nr:sigma 54-interacting transcriptional regulator [Melioribacteraceae bacterium]
MDVKTVIDRGKEVLIIPDGIAVIGKEHNIVVFNEAASRITGFNENDVVGEDCSILFEENFDGMNFLKESIRENRAFTNLAFNIKTKKESEKNVLASITPIVRNEKVISVVLVFRDTKEMLNLAKDLEEKTTELIDQKNKLDAIFNSNIEGTFTIDNEWNVTSFNLSAEKITGYKKNDAIGKKCWEIFNSSVCRKGCHMEQTINKDKPTIGNEVKIVDKNGKLIPIRVNSSILTNNKNEKIGAVETFLDISEIKNLFEHLDERFKYENIVGKNKEIKQIINVLESVAQTDSSVLVTGESGTGKELAARAIHLNSHRRTGPFIAVNCSAFAESLIESELFGHEKGAFTGAVKSKIGRFELAQNGTLFLDEIGDLSITVQTKLLRVLETKEIERVGSNKPIKINTRIIAATNKDLEIEIEAGRFREDLYYRINVMNIHLPPLRERKDDLPILVNHFIEKFNEKFKRNIKHFSSSAFDILMDYNWPGNIRELENVIEHCFVLCGSDVIQIEYLPKRLREENFNSITKNTSGNLNHLKDAERNIIINTLKKHNGNRSKTAEELHIHPTTLWRKMKKFNLLE